MYYDDGFRYAKEILEFVRSNVEMINFLQMYEDVYAVKNQSILVVKPPTAGKEKQAYLGYY